MGAVQAVALLLIGLAVASDEWLHNGAWVVAPLVSMILLCISMGYFWGRELYRYQLMQPMPTTVCVGGPMDGSQVPAPPRDIGGATVRVEDHEEGFYAYDG